MSTQTETCNSIICPPGTTQGVNIQNIEKQSGINFTQPRPTTPLPPLVQAFFNERTNILEVCAVVFIDANANLSPDKNTNQIIDVYYEDISPTPNFFITYNAVEGNSTNFQAYQVSFTIQMNSKPSNINTTVWDEDPKASRGTITTVQP